jgi:ribosomal subunit interface protein
MRVQIAARHCEVPEPVLERARTRIAGLVRYDPRLSSAEVIFDEERHRKRVEVILSVDRREPVVAGGEGTDFQGALDLTLDRASRKLRRLRDRAVDRQAAPRDVESSGASPDLVLE